LIDLVVFVVWLPVWGAELLFSFGTMVGVVVFSLLLFVLIWWVWIWLWLTFCFDDGVVCWVVYLVGVGLVGLFV